MKKPLRLEINNSGAWKVLGRFDTDDEFVANNVLVAAAQMAQALVAGGNRLTLRVSCADAPHVVLMHWSDQYSGWRDAPGGAA